MSSNQFTVLIERVAKVTLMASLVAALAACGGGTEDAGPADVQQTQAIDTDQVSGIVVSERPRALAPSTTTSRY